MPAHDSVRRLNRSWDSFDAYLFDIDGTLLTCADATHYFAFCHALKMLSGQDLTLDGVVAHGNVDAGILRDALRHAHIPEANWRPELAAAQRAMCDYVQQRRSELVIRTLPDAEKLILHLRTKGAKLAVATGNLECIGQLKLESAGLWKYFDFGGWSDAHEYRSDVFRATIQRARDLCGEGAEICALGDTPADIQAAHENHVPVIAVATGIYSLEELGAEEPELLLQSFTDLFTQNAIAR